MKPINCSSRNNGKISKLDVKVNAHLSAGLASICNQRHLLAANYTKVVQKPEVGLQTGGLYTTPNASAVTPKKLPLLLSSSVL
jgi:hypothetical protein